MSTGVYIFLQKSLLVEHALELRVFLQVVNLHGSGEPVPELHYCLKALVCEFVAFAYQGRIRALCVAPEVRVGRH